MDLEFRMKLLNGKGCICPTCDQFAKVYKRTIHNSVAQQLIKLYRLGGANYYIHSSKLSLSEKRDGSSDLSIAKHWKLIERSKSENPYKKHNGYWKLTELGVLFVEGRAQIDKYVLLYNDSIMGFQGDKIYINQCLDESFNYEQLMSW